ncbi:MAG: hypothetical protein RJA70_37 [Pseudomonadota bacterium]|jgi:AcrR family transcriptional regulator
MTTEPNIGKAPSRGKYDRAMSRAERLAAQREQIVAVARLALRKQSPLEFTMSNVAEQTGLGRNTVYSHFAHIDELTGLVLEESWRSLVELWDATEVDMGTPVGAAEQLSARWFRAVDVAVDELQVVLGCDRARVASRILSEVRAFSDAGAHAGTFRRPDELRLVALSAAVIAVLDYCVRSTDAVLGAPELVADVLVRALR